jgi:hypothetical protein
MSKRKAEHKCPYCGKFSRFIWIPSRAYNRPSDYAQSGQVAGKIICEQCRREM